MPKLQAVATGFRSFTESSIFAPTAVAIDVDALSDVDWGFNSGMAMDVSPMRQIKQEKISDVDVEEETEILKPTRKGKARAKADDEAKEKVDEDPATMIDFDAKFHERLPERVRNVSISLFVTTYSYYPVRALRRFPTRYLLSCILQVSPK